MSATATILATIGNEPEIRELRPGMEMWKARLKVPRKVRRNGEESTTEDWWSAVCFGRLVEDLRSAKTGDVWVLSGPCYPEQWEGRDGDMRTTLNVKVSHATKVSTAPRAKAAPAARDYPDEDIPF